MLLLGVTLYLMAMSIIAFVAYGSDKRRARRDSWRIPERHLLFLAAAGGALGAVVAMRAFHHKTRKAAFRFGVPALAALQVLLFVCVLGLVLYTAHPHQADATARAALSSPPSSTQVRETDDGWLFDGPGTNSLLVFYPGGLVEAEAYAPLMGELASRGLDCELVNMPLHLALLGVNQADKAIRSTSYDHYYVGGHSLGGFAASLFAAGNTDEFDGLVLLASYATSDLSQSGLDVLSVYGTADAILNREKYDRYRNNLPDSTTELVIEGGNHAQFGSYGPQEGDGTASITAEEQRALTADAIIELASRP